MLLKLYKREEDTTLYWEAWDEDDQIVIHFGELGQMGETTNIPINEFEPPDAAIQRQADEARAAGFFEIEHEDLYELIVQYPAEKGEPQDFEEFANKVGDVLNDCLGWTGLGHCDGNEIGNGVINVFSYVVDAKVASEPVINELTEQGLIKNAVIAYQDHDENFVVVYPKDYDKPFSP